jgi:hypothetical protein
MTTRRVPSPVIVLEHRPGKPLISADHNPNRQRPTREGAVLASASFEEWVQRTLWYLAAP